MTNVNIDDVVSINMLFQHSQTIPLIGDQVNVKLTDFEVTGIVLSYQKVNWTSKAELKILFLVKVLDVEHYLKKPNLKLL